MSWNCTKGRKNLRLFLLSDSGWFVFPGSWIAFHTVCLRFQLLMQGATERSLYAAGEQRIKAASEFGTKRRCKVWLWLLKSDLIFRGRRSKARGSARILFLYRNGGGRVVDAEEARRTIRSTQDALQMNVLSCCTVSSQTTVLTSCQRESDLNKTNTQSTWQIEIESVMASFLRLIIRLPLYFLLSRLWLLHLSSPDNQAAC